METTDLFIKICCIADIEEAKLAMSIGASALGLVSQMPSGPGVIDEKTIARVAADVRGEVETFLLTSLSTSDEIAAQHRRCRTSTLQLVDHLTPETLKRMRDSVPEAGLVQVIHVNGPESVDYAMEIEACVDRILLDSGNPALAVKELGGTGRTHNWSISRQIRDAVSIPVLLAGGLRPANVTSAIQAVRPFGVDICSGVRTDGRLDEAKVRTFVDTARGAQG